MSKLLYFTFILLSQFCIGQNSAIQERIVSGIVKDSLGPIPGVNVSVEGTQRGMHTDMDGKYSIKISPDQYLVFSFIGMIEKRVKANSTEINVVLKNDNLKSKETVGPAYYPRRMKNHLTIEKETVKKTDILPSDYKTYTKTTTFLKLLKKSIKYKKKNKTDEFEFVGYSNSKTQECKFAERVISYEKNETVEKRVEYYFINQHLIYKDVCFLYTNHPSKCLEIIYFKSGKIKSFEDGTKRYYLDENGNLINAPGIIEEKINDSDTKKIAFGEYKQICTKLSELEKGYEFNKVLESYTLKDWVQYNKIRDYLKKTLRLNTDVYFLGLGIHAILMISENGNFYDLTNENGLVTLNLIIKD